MLTSPEFGGNTLHLVSRLNRLTNTKPELRTLAVILYLLDICDVNFEVFTLEQREALNRMCLFFTPNSCRNHFDLRSYQIVREVFGIVQDELAHLINILPLSDRIKIIQLLPEDVI